MTEQTSTEKTPEQIEIEALRTEVAALKQDLQIKNKSITKYAAALQGIFSTIQAVSD